MMFDRFTVSDGFTLIKHQREVDIGKSRAYLTGRGKRKVFYMDKNNDTGESVVVTKLMLVCPSCGTATPPSERFLDEYESGSFDAHERHGSAPTVSEIREFLSDQYSLFPSEPMTINNVFVPKEYRCRGCNAQITESHSSFDVSIMADKNIVIMDVFKPRADNTLFKLMVKEKEFLPPLKSYTERTVFHIKGGKVFWQILNEEGLPVMVRDCTYNLRSWASLDSYHLLSSHFVLRRKLTRAFQHTIPNYPIPASDMSPLHAVLTTMFVGYSSDFYRNIPIHEEDGLDPRFKHLAKKMHKAADLRKLFESSKLPQKQSVRSLFIAKPELFFFLEQAEELASVLGNLDLFTTVLSSDNCFNILSDMLSHSLSPFLCDYAAVKSPKQLTTLLVENWDYVRNYAKDYCASSTATRKLKRKSWEKSKEPFHDTNFFQIPYTIPDYSVVEGYEFVRLRSPQQFYKAADELKNCLRSYIDRSVVAIFAIRRNGHFIAAIEVVGQNVFQFLGIENEDIEPSTPLYRAFTRWVAKNSLSVFLKNELDLDDEEYFDEPALA